MAIDYTLDWSDGSFKPPFTLLGKTVDTTTTSLALTGKGTINWGEHFEENFLRLLEHFASNGIPPLHPTPGQLWFDASTNTLSLYQNGSFADALSPAYTGLAGINIASVQAAIAAAKPRVIRASHLGSGWYDWWGGINVVNFTGQTPSRPGLANVWIPVSQSICHIADAPISYVSSIANKLVTSFKITQPARVGILIEFSGSISPAQALYSVNLTYKFERSYDNGVSWVPGNISSNRVWGAVSDSGGNTIANSSIALMNIVKPNGAIYRNLETTLPAVNPPDSGLTSHLINLSGVDQGVWYVDEPPLEANVTHRLTVYATVGVMNASVTLKQLGCNAKFFLIGE